MYLTLYIVTSKDVIQSLENANQYYSAASSSSSSAGKILRHFTEKHIPTIINAILNLQYDTVDEMKKPKVEKILRLVIDIICKELLSLSTNDSRGGQSSTSTSTSSSNNWTLHMLASIFNKQKPYYARDPMADTTTNISSSRCGVRINQINIFSKSKGFNLLSSYMKADASSLVVDDDITYYVASLHPLLEALFEAITITNEKECENVYSISESVMEQLLQLDQEVFVTKFTVQQLDQVLINLQRINKRLVFSNKCHAGGSNQTSISLLDYYKFCQSLVLKLIQLDTNDLSLVGHVYFGFKLIEKMIRETHLPKSYIVSGAGSSFVNGRYELASSALGTSGTSDGGQGIITGRSIVYYEHIVSNTNPNVKARDKTLKLQPCLMLEAGSAYLHTWYFITDDDGNDYYFNKSKPNEVDRLPYIEWQSCGDGVDPSPTLQQHQSEASSGLVPIGDDKNNTLEQQLSKWIVQNKVFDIVIGMQNSFMATAPSAVLQFLSRINGGNNILDQKCKLLEPIIPLLSKGSSLLAQKPAATTPPSKQSSAVVVSSTSTISSPSSDYFSAIGAAEQRLSIAKQWMRSTESVLLTNMKHYCLASKEVQNARSYLKEMEESHGVINVDENEDEDDANDSSSVDVIYGNSKEGDKKQPAKRQCRR